MKVSFSLKDVTTLKSFFNVDADFLDVLVTKDIVYFCLYRTGIYSHIEFPVISRQNLKDIHAFRISRKSFLSLIDESLITISIIGDGQVLIEIEPKEKSPYTISLDHQLPNLGTIFEYLDILEKNSSFRPIILSPLKSKIPLLRAHDGVVTVANKLIKMELDHVNTFINANVEDLAIQTSFLKYLLDYSDVTYVYRQVLIGKGEGISIVCNQAVPEFNNEFGFVRKARSLGKFNVDLSPIARLVAKSSSEVQSVNLDFDRKKAYFTSSGIKLATEFHVEDLDNEISLSDEDLMSLLDESPAIKTESKPTKFVLPMRLFKDLLPKATYNLTVEVKKRFLILSNNRDVNFVVGRSTYSD